MKSAPAAVLYGLKGRFLAAQRQIHLAAAQRIRIGYAVHREAQGDGFLVPVRLLGQRKEQAADAEARAPMARSPLAYTFWLWR